MVFILIGFGLAGFIGYAVGYIAGHKRGMEFEEGLNSFQLEFYKERERTLWGQKDRLEKLLERQYRLTITEGKLKSRQYEETS